MPSRLPFIAVAFLALAACGGSPVGSGSSIPSAPGGPAGSAASSASPQAAAPANVRPAKAAAASVSPAYDWRSAIHELADAQIPKTEAQWKALLTPEQYGVLRQQGTETPFSSPLDFETRKGTYVGADCGEPLFRSEQKYDSGTGWPSFWAPIGPDAVELRTDTSAGITRTEVVSKKCGGHLGHMFDDGPPPTGKRYCMNGLALKFIPDPPYVQ